MVHNYHMINKSQSYCLILLVKLIILYICLIYFIILCKIIFIKFFLNFKKSSKSQAITHNLGI